MAGPLLGLCATNLAPIIAQLTSPIGSPPIHFSAPSSDVSWGPFPLAPLTVGVVCFEFTGNVLGGVSPAARIVVQ